MAQQPAPHRVQQDAAEAGERAADHDEFGIEQVADVGQCPPHRQPGILDHAEGGRVSVQGDPDNVLGADRGVAAVAEQIDHGGRGRDGLQAAAVAATADDAVFGHRGMADLARDPDVAVIEFAVEDQACTDTGSNFQERKVLRVLVRAPADVRERAQIRIVVHEHVGAEAFLQPGQQVDAHPFGQDGAVDHGAGPAVDRPGDAGTDAEHRAGGDRMFIQQPLDQPGGGVDALLGVVAEGKFDGVRGKQPVVQAHQHHLHVPAAEIHSDGDGAAAVDPDRQRPAAGTGGRCGADQSVFGHGLDDVGHGGGGQPGVPGQLRLRQRAAGHQRLQDPLAVPLPQGALGAGPVLGARRHGARGGMRGFGGGRRIG